MRVAFGLLLSPLLLVQTGQSPLRPSGTVIVTNMNDHTATTLDAGSGAVLATLSTGEAPHEVAVSHAGRWAVVSNYGVRERPGTTLTVIDIDSLKVTRTIDSLLAVTSEASQAVFGGVVRRGAGRFGGPDRRRYRDRPLDGPDRLRRGDGNLVGRDRVLTPQTDSGDRLTVGTGTRPSVLTVLTVRP